MLFRRKQLTELPIADEINAHKDANKAAIHDAQAATVNLKQLYDGNGFTVIIAKAMGATHHGKVADNGH